MLLVVNAALLLQATAPITSVIDPSTLRHANWAVPPAVTAVRVARAPLLDGRLDDDAWQAATPISDLVQSDPEEGQPVSQATEIRIVYDDDALYIGARLHDREAARIVGRLGRRDAYTDSDDFRVLLDSYHDHNTAFRFDVNPAGVRSDLVFGDDGGFADNSWDPVWDAATSRDSSGWTAELRIPFSQLRFSGAREQRWGVRFVRTIQRRNEFALWPFVGKTENGFVSRFGHLLGIEGIPAPRRLEALPYSVARGTSSPTAVHGSPFASQSAYVGSAGLDLKYGLTSNLTLDAAVNPDFGQVESDPAFVNLTAFEQFLEERRPFFVEGASIFNFGGGAGFIRFGGTPQVFYSRRIGRPPTGAYTTAGVPGFFLSLPTSTTLLGATKLTGRTPSGWSVGLLEAVTPVERAWFEDTLGVRSLQDAEPLTNFVVTRAKREIHNGQTGLGVLATAVNRDLQGAGINQLRSAAYVAGADFFHRWQGSKYTVNASVSLAHVRGDTLAIQATQLQSSRYYARPDAGHIDYERTRTSLTGVSADFAFNKGGGATNWALGASTTTPGYEVNDLGFQTRVDRISGAAFLGHRWTKPGKVFRLASLGFSAGPSWNYGGDNIQNSISLNGFGQLKNFSGFNVNAGTGLRATDDRLTRGGPLARKPVSYYFGGGYFSDNRKALQGSLFVFYNGDEAGGWSTSISPFVSVRPSGAVEFTVGPNYFVGKSRAQFVRRKTDSTAVATYGARYVFADLLQHSLDVTLRVNVTMSPALSFQLYAQPFDFAGDYSGFKELRAARTFDFTVYGRDNGSSIAVASSDPQGRPAVYQVDPSGAAGDSVFTFTNPDFRTRSLRSNAVLRWEYRPGSTIFLVWTQSRGSFAPYDPAFDVGRDFSRELFLDRPQNVLLVKVNYWLSL